MIPAFKQAVHTSGSVAKTARTSRRSRIRRDTSGADPLDDMDSSASDIGVPSYYSDSSGTNYTESDYEAGQSSLAHKVCFRGHWETYSKNSTSDTRPCGPLRKPQATQLLIPFENLGNLLHRNIKWIHHQVPRRDRKLIVLALLQPQYLTLLESIVSLN